MTAMLDKPSFFKALEDARRPKHGGAHPFSAAWAQGALTRADLGQWAIQHFYYIDTVPQQFGHLFMRYPDLDARQYLLENLLGEENPAKPEARHPGLLVRFAAACGVSAAEVTGADVAGRILPSTRAMRAWLWELTMIRSLAEASAGIMVALEGQLPTLYPGYVRAMEKMGFARDELEFFWVHIENDEAHAGTGLELAWRYATTPALQAAAIAAVRASTQMRWQLLDGILALVGAKKAA